MHIKYFALFSYLFLALIASLPLFAYLCGFWISILLIISSLYFVYLASKLNKLHAYCFGYAVFVIGLIYTVVHYIFTSYNIGSYNIYHIDYAWLIVYLVAYSMLIVTIGRHNAR